MGQGPQSSCVMAVPSAETPQVSGPCPGLSRPRGDVGQASSPESQCSHLKPGVVTDPHRVGSLFKFKIFILFIYWLFRAAPAAHGSSQVRVELELQLPAYTTATTRRIQAVSVTYTQAHGNTRSLTY